MNKKDKTAKYLIQIKETLDKARRSERSLKRKDGQIDSLLEKLQSFPEKATEILKTYRREIRRISHLSVMYIVKK